MSIPDPNLELLRQQLVEHIRELLQQQLVEQIRASEERMRTEIRASEERARRHLDVVAEGLRSDIKLVAEGVGAVDEKLDRFRVEVREEFGKVDRRFLRLEAKVSSSS